MKSLDQILEEYFGCKKPFLNSPRSLDDGKEYFTKSGAMAYERLVSLLYDLACIGVIKDAHSSINELDTIVRGE